MELVLDRQTKEPASEATAAIAVKALELGLILMRAGTYDNVIRVLVPLVASDAQVDEGLDILENAISRVQSGRSGG
jgi:4-aminobutyrate aminotransferase/(S)-3-amino-2-methylpropionate transaminase